MTFDQCFEVVMEIEGFGSVVDDPEDNGGLTKWGISKKAHPELSEEDIRTLTKEKAKAIYKRKYWDEIAARSLPAFIRLSSFDACVNHGITGGAKLMQKAANVDKAGLEVDGVIGPLSQKAIKKLDPKSFLINLSLQRLRLFQRHEDFQRFGDGWTKRLFKVAIETV
ncbi:MAG: hypothetical protein EOP04_01900 [Proteobacteria bacterium]|nr:MAG: hypothetical protein EOP04_01900 [Pseudomonadota bacterium]